MAHPSWPFARGALGEIVDDTCGVLVPADDVPALARAMDRLTALPRTRARARAVTVCSHVAMIDSYCNLYAELAAPDLRAA